MPLATLSETFTHYDLHSRNVLIYEPVPGKYIDYKYVCCAKDPIELMLKYSHRGYGIYLNINEKKSVIKYIMKNEKYWKQYNITNDDTYKTACNKIFKLVSILLNDSLPWSNIPLVAPITTNISSLSSNFARSDFYHRAIDKHGDIIPFDMSVCENYFILFNKN